MTARLAMLGPQRHTVTAGQIAQLFAPTGTIATINAGWQEREAEDAELDEVLGGRSVNLSLYGRANRVWGDDPLLRAAHKDLQARLHLLRESYNVRLARMMDAWSAVEDLEGDPEILDPERIAALESMRELDARHLHRVQQLRERYEPDIRPRDHAGLQQQRHEIAALIEEASAIVVAGGHVAVLINRLRLFDLEPLIRDKPIASWSAGAMALSDRIILFHDTPPQGTGNAEVLDAGLGIASDVVVLPHARERLQLDDRRRVSRFARRFRPAICAALDDGEGIERLQGRWVPLRGGDAPLGGARCLSPDGHVEELAA